MSPKSMPHMPPLRYYFVIAYALLFVLLSPQTYAFFKPSPKKIFSAMDIDDNGEVSKEEMIEFLINRRGVESSKAEQLYTCIDKNSDDKLSIDEIQNLMKARESIEKNGAC